MNDSVRDPFGHEWMLQQEIEKVSPAEMQRRWDAMVKPLEISFN
jgi:PhnB protein